MHKIQIAETASLPAATLTLKIPTAISQHLARCQWLLLLFTSTVLATAPPNHPLDKDADYQVAGLQKPAEILIDQWGVPHIYAKDHYDVFFVQGFNAARDRLWQIDLWRKRGLGKLAESFGEAYVEQDKAARLFLYRGDMYSEWLAYGNDAKKIAQAFSAGINAFIDLTDNQPQLLPPEFNLLNYKPERWAAEDVVRIRSHGLWRNIKSEVWRARLACEGHLDVAAQWKQLEPDWETQVPEGLDPCVIPDNVLHLYNLATAPVSFTPGKPLAALISGVPGASPGSNNWAVAPHRTRTGRPILADDPHRGHAVPSLRYIAHLVGPGINVIGAGEPGLPGISIGHNERIAFGLTIFRIDQEDLYVYRKTRGGYAYQGRSEPFTEVTDTVQIADAEPQQITLKFTRHGPVIAETRKHAFVVRAAWLEPGMAPYFGSIEYMRAQNFRTFVGALNRWGAPSENQVYADVDGNIGYKPAGRFPIRRTWDGLLPVPGDGTYEWQGYFDMDVLPEEYNPDRGFTGTANSMNLPEDYPIDQYRVGFEWTNPWRYQQLWRQLTPNTQHSLQDSLDLQRDYHSILAERLLAKLPQLPDTPAGEMLTDWDHVLGPESAAAALWNIWFTRYLTPALGDYVLRDVTQRPDGVLDPMTILDLLDTSTGQDIAYRTLQAAWQEAERLLGDQPDNWQWGNLHQIHLRHPLLSHASGPLQKAMQLPVYPLGGSAYTANASAYHAENFQLRLGASFRMVVDVGNWDNAFATNTPGQSGDPRSKYYANLLENWATDQAFPLLYSRAAVEANRAFTIRLTPEPSSKTSSKTSLKP